MSALPIHDVLPEVLARLARATRLVLEAPPGAGKTTQVPLALLGAPWCTGKVLMLEPRRIAARAAAGFIAAQLGETVGATVGYRIRLEQRVTAATRLEIVTEGILTRRIQEDPQLEGISAVVFDEFHERHLAADLGLALCLDVQASLREDLRLVVMSATLDGERVARFLDAPRVTSAGRSFPVRTVWLPALPQEPPVLHLRRAIRQALADNPGDVLCFLPGRAEIERAARQLADLDAEVAQLHGELAIEAQSRLLVPGTRRRVILATNVAESSVTLPGIKAVVDTGLAREPRFDPGSGLGRLETVTVPQSSATQRAGRAGRVAPGTCYRLWPESQRLDPAPRPEIQHQELSALALELAAWGSANLRFLDPAPPGALAQAREILRLMGALDTGDAITAHGRALLASGTQARFANAIARAPAELRGLACDLAALLEARDPLRGDSRRSDALAARCATLHAWRGGRREQPEVDRGGLVRIDQVARELRRRHGLPAAHGELPSAHDVGRVLALAYPDRVACRDADSPRRYQLGNGRGVRCAEDSVLAGEPWLVVSDLRFDPRDSLVLRGAPVSLANLQEMFPAALRDTHVRAFNRATRAVETRRQRCLWSIVLDDRLLPTPRDEMTSGLLIEGVRTLGLAVLPWTESLREWQARLQSLRAWCPELGLPDLGDAALLAEDQNWLAPLLDGMTRLDELAPAALTAALHGRLDHAARRALDSHAPGELLVPSGQSRRLVYSPGQPPVLAVKLQELFGLADTPRIARGRVPVVLHLLSPRQTPIQVTQDLRSFWEHTYPEVRRELKGRYPRHPWPEDPWHATATHRAKPRGT